MTWNTSVPAGSDDASLGDDVIRELKTDLQDALQAQDPAAESVFPGADIANPVYRYRGLKGPTTSRPAAGDYGLFFDTTRGVIQRDNGTSWEDVGPVFPPGVMVDYAAGSAPLGWLLCDGSAVSRTTYANLFAIIGVAFGVGDSVTTFNLPDFRGRVPVGTGAGSGLTARTLAATGGEETHLLTTAEIPAHSHSTVESAHTHKVRGASNGSGNVGINTPPGPQVIPGSSNFTVGEAYYANSPGGGAQLIESTATGLTVSNAGGGGAHNVVQPFLVATKIIKT